jgi:glycine oxidase
VNVTIIGAGIVGCAVAHELAARGARVRVIDPRGTGQGATRASAGMLAPYIEGHSPALLELTLRSLRLYDDFIARLGAEAAQPPEYARNGTLQVAAGEAESAALAAAAAHLAELGVAHSWLDAAAVRRLEPNLSPCIEAALLVPEHGYVAAAALTRALAGAAAARGVLFTTETVERVASDDRGALAMTATGTIESDALVIAAGSWSSQVAGVQTAPAPVKPIRGQLVVLQAPARPASHVIWGGGCYLVPWRDGTVLAGATVEDVGFDETPTTAGVEQMTSAAATVIPSLAAAEFREVRVGLRPLPGDELPAIGRSSTMPRVFYATGHYRNGVLLAPWTAAVVADLVLDGRERPELALTRPGRFGL